MKQFSLQLAFCASVPLALSALCGFTASRSWWCVPADCGIEVRRKPRSGTDIDSPCSPLPCPMPMPGLAPSCSTPFSSLSVKCLHESFCGGRVQVAQALSQLARPPWTTTWKPCRARHVAHFLRTDTLQIEYLQARARSYSSGRLSGSPVNGFPFHPPLPSPTLRPHVGRVFLQYTILRSQHSRLFLPKAPFQNTITIATACASVPCPAHPRPCRPAHSSPVANRPFSGVAIFSQDKETARPLYRYRDSSVLAASSTPGPSCLIDHIAKTSNHVAAICASVRLVAANSACDAPSVGPLRLASSKPSSGLDTNSHRQPLHIMSLATVSPRKPAAPLQSKHWP